MGGGGGRFSLGFGLLLLLLFLCHCFVSTEGGETVRQKDSFFLRNKGLAGREASDMLLAAGVRVFMAVWSYGRGHLPFDIAIDSTQLK